MLGIFIYAITVTYTAADVLSQGERLKPSINNNLTFKDYLQQFKPNQVWQNIEENNKLKGVNNSFKDELHNIMSHIDETDDLLNLKVKNGNPNTIVDKDGRRRFRPPGYLLTKKYDPYRVRPRLVELIKQAVYQTRNKMTIMQRLREKYNKMSLYKMGFLIAKTDNVCKTFSQFAYKTMLTCSSARQYANKRFSVLDNLEANERLIDLWFDVDLLIDLVVLNHENCLRMLNQVIANRKYAWKFVD